MGSGSGSGSGSGGPYSASVSSSGRRENSPRLGFKSGSWFSSITASTVLPTTSSRETGRGGFGNSLSSFSRSTAWASSLSRASSRASSAASAGSGSGFGFGSGFDSGFGSGFGSGFCSSVRSFGS